MTTMNFTIPVEREALACHLSDEPEACGVLMNLLVLQWTHNMVSYSLDECLCLFGGEFNEATVEAMEKVTAAYRKWEAAT